MSLPVTQNILSCFDDLITLDGCTDIVSTSGFRMDEIGINKFELDQYINREYQSGKALFEAKRELSIKLIANQIETALQKNFKAKTLIDSLHVGSIDDNMKSQSDTSNYWVGQEFNLVNNESYFEVFISEVSVFTNYTGPIELRIYDLKTGKILKSQSGDDYVFIVDGIAGEIVSVYPQIKIQSSKRELDLFIGYNTSLITPYKVSIINGGCKNCGDPCNRTRYSNVWGAKVAIGSSFIKSNVKHDVNTGGLSVTYSVNCSNQLWICSMSNLIALPVLYKTASELMDYGLNISDQIGPKTYAGFNFEKLKERKAEYEFKSREALDNTIGNIILPTDNICFVCDKKVMYKTMIP